MRVLVTGGNGFIGSAVVRHLIGQTNHDVINLDKMTYSATVGSVASVSEDARYRGYTIDICDEDAVAEVFAAEAPDAVVHLAAESHVDRSIDGPAGFVRTNLVGTFTLLEAARSARIDRFLHVSTDEVFGALKPGDAPFDESTAYAPRSPYSATKAGSDHLVAAWGHTYDLPVLITSCSNNYGPFQFPEKLIPLMVIRGLQGESLPVYGGGQQIRDWLHVEDHAAALCTVLTSGVPGERYVIGGSAATDGIENVERTNLEVVEMICDTLDEVMPAASGESRRGLITHVDDRPGHDFRYAVDAARIREELGWRPTVEFVDGLRNTVAWYLENRAWWEPLVASNTDAAPDALRRRGASA